MRRLSILAAALAACLLFTACPNKPTDEPVIIPDGVYEETARYCYRHIVGDIYPYTERDTSVRFLLDSVFTASVIISGGDFIYPDMCKDTAFILPSTHIVWNDHFIYSSNSYCTLNRNPARTSDGYVILEWPQFRTIGIDPHPDRSYVYRARVSRIYGGYTFRQVHHFDEDNEYNPCSALYDITHTLRPL